MNIIVLTPIRILGDGLATCLSQRADITVVAVVSDLAVLRPMLSGSQTDMVLIDVTQGVDLYDVRSIAVAHPELALVALGLTEQRQDVIRCGQAGFCGYVGRDVTVDVLCEGLLDVLRGRLTCSAEISGSLMRALFRQEPPADALVPAAHALTCRESEVLHLIGQGMSNKEIARTLSISVATVKHHVHNLLEKMGLPGRAQAMRRVRDAPWLAALPAPTLTRKLATPS
jgi:DNA-binding NarL/FixJ family response regulator